MKLSSFTSTLIRASALVSSAAVAGGCAESGAGEVGQATFPLTDAAFFRLRIYDGPDSVGSEDAVFDTGCIQRQSRTYELTNIPVGTGYAVLYEGFSGSTCDAGSKLEDGYRGGVSIAKADQPYYHVPVYPVGGVGTLPENLNLSAAVATAVEFCNDSTGCDGKNACYDAAKPDYWCVPSCSSDADCTGLHPRATCDLATSWCMLRSPYPLNLSEPRALGAATTLENGDVLFVGGLRDKDAGGFGPTEHWLERFDAATGLAAPAEVSGATALPAGLFGFAKLDDDRFVVVGGVSALAGLGWDAQSESLKPEAEWSQVLVASATVFEPGSGLAKTSTLVRGVIDPTVVALAPDRFWVAGGLVASGADVEPTKASWICTVGEDLTATCGAGVQLKAPRFHAAAACLDAQCQKVLLVGGNAGDQLAELVDFSANTADALNAEGLPAQVFRPDLCGLDLIGGSTASASPDVFAAVHLAVEGKKLTATPIAGAASTVFYGAFAQAGDHCYLGGGLGAGGAALASLAEASPDGFATLPGATFGQARTGAVAAVIGDGPLAGRVVFGGGFAVVSGGSVATVVRGLEVLTP
ncbi:MAG: hypothetical protein U1F43_10225 [Myxococcota bacterium]